MLPENTAVTSKAWQPEENILNILEASAGKQGALLLLPTKVSESGVALYRADEAGLIKTARHKGLSIDRGTAQDISRYVSEYSAGEVIVSIALGVVGNLTTDYLKAVAAVTRIRVLGVLAGIPPQSTRDKVKISIAEVEIGNDVRRARGVEIEAPVKYFSDSDETIASILSATIKEISGGSER